MSQESITVEVQPFQLTSIEWGRRHMAAKALMAGNCVPERVTKTSGAVMIAAAKEIDYLDFGVRQELADTLAKVQSGELKLSPFGRLRLIIRLERPTRFIDVWRRAKRLGLIQ